MTDLRGHIAQALHEHGRSFNDLERIADEVGIPKGQRATDHQLAQVLVRVTTPPEVSEPVTATGSAAVPPAAAESGNPSFDDVLRVTGGTEVPTPKPNRTRTTEEAIADAKAKAKVGA